MIRPHYVALYQSICRSKKLAALPDDTCRLFFHDLLTNLDSYGRCEADPATLNALVWPMLRKSDAETERAIKALQAVGLIVLYEVDGLRFLVDPAWERMGGKIGRPERRGDSLWPAPPNGVDSSQCGTTPASAGLVLPRARVGSDRIGSDEGVQREAPRPRDRPDTRKQQVAMHPTLETPDVHAALDRWEGHLRERGRAPYTPHVWEANLVKWERWGAAALVVAVDGSIQANVCTVFQSDHHDKPPPKSVGPRQPEAPDADEVRQRWERKHRRKMPHPMIAGQTVDVVDAYPGLEKARAELAGVA